MTPDAAAAAVAAEQLGLITRQQARRAGLTDHAIASRLATGRWRRVRPRVFAIEGCPPTYEQAVLAACLSAAGVGCQLTAAKVWGLRLLGPDAIDVLTADDRRVRLPGVKHHRTSSLVESHVAHRRGVPVTSVARTLVDCSGLVTSADLGDAVDDALRRGMVRSSTLGTVLAALSGPGRRPSAAMAAVLAARRPGFEPLGSRREQWVLRTLDAAGIPRPVPQFRVPGTRYRLDFAYPELLAGLEYDGWDAHSSRSAFDRDRRRWRRLTTLGWRLVVFTSATKPRELIGDVHQLLIVSGQSRGA